MFLRESAASRQQVRNHHRTEVEPESVRSWPGSSLPREIQDGRRSDKAGISEIPFALRTALRIASARASAPIATMAPTSLQRPAGPWWKRQRVVPESFVTRALKPLNLPATMASAGLARTINSVFTTRDGDSVFAASTRALANKTKFELGVQFAPALR